MFLNSKTLCSGEVLNFAALSSSLIALSETHRLDNLEPMTRKMNKHSFSDEKVIQLCVIETATRVSIFNMSVQYMHVDEV